MIGDTGNYLALAVKPLDVATPLLQAAKIKQSQMEAQQTQTNMQKDAAGQFARDMMSIDPQSPEYAHRWAQGMDDLASRDMIDPRAYAQLRDNPSQLVLHNLLTKSLNTKDYLDYQLKKKGAEADDQFGKDIGNIFGGRGGQSQGSISPAPVGQTPPVNYLRGSPAALPSDPATGAPPRAAVQPTARVWGDKEGEAAGLYDKPLLGGPQPSSASPNALAAPTAQAQQPGGLPGRGAGSDPMIQKAVPIAMRALTSPLVSQGTRDAAKTILEWARDDRKPTNDQREYATYFDQGGTDTFTDWLRKNKQAGATAITNDMRGENEEAKAMGKSAGERAGTTVAAAGKASNTLQNLNRMSALLDNVEQGKVQPARQTISAWAKSLGLDDAAAERIGLDPKGVGTAQAVQALSNELAMGRIGTGGIPANNFSDADRNFLTQTVPQLAHDPAANKIMIESSRRMAQLDIQKGKEWLAFRRDPANKGKSYDDFEIDWSDKTAKQDVFGDLRRQADALLGSTKRGSSDEPAPRGMPAGAKQAPDGNWYVKDPQRPGKYLQVR